MFLYIDVVVPTVQKSSVHQSAKEPQEKKSKKGKKGKKKERKKERSTYFLRVNDRTKKFHSS